jgi:GNAT superfamily N-acetyltransferase
MTGNFNNVSIRDGTQRLISGAVLPTYRLAYASGGARFPAPQAKATEPKNEVPGAAPRAGIRAARPEDAAVIEALIRAIAPESPVYRDTPIDDRKLKTFIATAIRSDQHAVLLHDGAAGIDGLYIGMLVQQFFTFEVTAMDILFYVRPERRGTRAALRLWRAFESWAHARGAKAIQVGSMTDIDPARTAKFYRGMGLREIGGVFQARIG